MRTQTKWSKPKANFINNTQKLPTVRSWVCCCCDHELIPTEFESVIRPVELCCQLPGGSLGPLRYYTTLPNY